MAQPAAWLSRVRRHSQALLLLLALALGGAGAYGARGYIAQQIAAERERLQPRQPMVSIVVAKRDLAKGDVLDIGMLAAREIPRTFLAPGTVVPERVDEFLGARLIGPLRAGEPLLQGAMEGVDVSTFAAKVPAGVRAFTVVVDEVNSLSGMLQPGDRIDLLLSVRPPANASQPSPPEITRTLLQDIKVLATGRHVRPGAEDKAVRTYGAITVEVSPEQAARLVVAQRNGRLSAILRNPHDRLSAPVPSVDVYDLLGLASPGPVLRAPREAARSTELIVGGQGQIRPRSIPDAASMAGIASSHPSPPPPPQVPAQAAPSDPSR